MWWEIAVVSMAFGAVHFASMFLVRPVWVQECRGTDGKFQAGHNGEANRFTKQRLLPGNRSVSHQSQSHHHAVVNVVSQGMNTPFPEGLVLNIKLQSVWVIYVYIRDNRNNRRNSYSAYEHGGREWMLLTSSCGYNYVYCRNVWRDMQLPWVLQ